MLFFYKRKLGKENLLLFAWLGPGCPLQGGTVSVFTFVQSWMVSVFICSASVCSFNACQWRGKKVCFHD